MTHSGDDINQKQWEDFNKELDLLEADNNLDFINEDPMTKIVTPPLESNDEMMRERISFLLGGAGSKRGSRPGNGAPLTSPPLKIIEFGGAYGNFCRLYTEQVPNAEFTIVDNSSMLKFTKVFLEKYGIKATFIDSRDVFSLEEKFDMMVAFSSLSETDPKFTKKVFNKFLPNCDSVYVGEPANILQDWTQEFEKYFEYGVRLETARQRSHFLLYAYNKIPIVFAHEKRVFAHDVQMHLLNDKNPIYYNSRLPL